MGRLIIGRTYPRAVSSIDISPVWATVLLTHNCNYKCVMCSFWHQRTTGELTLDELRTVIADLKAVGVSQLNFSGGEPFLRPDLDEIVECAVAQGFSMVQVTTNGSIAREHRLEKLFGAGLSRISMSVDGVGAHHETQRGVPGSWKKCISTLETIRKLRRRGFESAEAEIAIVLTKLNSGDLPELLRLCDEYDAVLQLQFLQNVEFFTDPDTEQYALSGPELDELIAQIHGYVGSRSMDPLMTHMGLEYIRRHLKGEPPEKTLPRPSCGVGYAMFLIDSLGEAYAGCFATRPVGNVRKKRLKELVNSDEHRRRAREQFELDCPRCPQGLAWGTFINPRALASEAGWRLRDQLAKRLGRRPRNGGG